ncbi:Arylsulfatase [Polystyrenella longa]|uniref:Arylsulfatase n=1 Tax=Polystyrenella longa TaxID=2528007 RepID=A0A518CJV2_9PLAN|nr:sulfatase-like hydrolase/transferase [Polystyrenella longa]QDU79509.1 Arylsulfatase [Polystyrenella longa]
MRIALIRRLLLAFTLLFLGVSSDSSAAEKENIPVRPNILWISCEDISPHLGCYGDPHANTPNLDQLATEGTRYTHAFTTAGVCAPCRSAIITGVYQSALGTHHMRCNAKLPESIKPFPMYLREAGYYCTNKSKQDYQFPTPKGTWDVSSNKKEAHWRNRKEKDQPFFAVFNFTGCHESGIANTNKYQKVTKNLTAAERQDARQLTTLPPYYPDTPVIREDWKRNYELITAMDHWAGDLIAQLQEDGLYENTIILFWSDHGVGLPRAKRWLYDSGTHIPLITRIPEQFRMDGQGEPGTVNDQLVSSIDFGPTVLKLAGVEIPENIQGQPFIGSDLPAPRDYVYGARDRMDERYDIIRMVRDKKYKYIRNYEPWKPILEYVSYLEQGATMSNMRDLHEAGELPPKIDNLFTEPKAIEELYDCEADPHEMTNLANHLEYHEVLARMRNEHLRWMKEVRDLGLIPEPILHERRAQLGSEYAILRQPDSLEYMDQLLMYSKAATQGELSLLQIGLNDEDNVIRYWSVTGMGNLAKQQPLLPQDVDQLLDLAENDPTPVVRIQAARALCYLGQAKVALPILLHHLDSGTQWDRVYAATVLDEINELARPVVDEMKVGLEPVKEFESQGKYRVRIINRALNQLLGTRNSVE